MTKSMPLLLRQRLLIKHPQLGKRAPCTDKRALYTDKSALHLGSGGSGYDEKPNISANCTEYAAAAMVAAAKKPLVLAMKKGMLCGGGSY